MDKMATPVGAKFNRLTVLSEVDGVKPTRWSCVCECGNKVEVRAYHVTKSATKSCGCLRTESSRCVNRQHGMRTEPEYGVWASIKARCLNPRTRNYARYGGRGIKMYRQWQDSFAAFIADVGRRPTESHSLDRVDNDGDYAPGNVRWATIDTQNNNRRDNIRLEYRGRTQTLAQWAKETAIPASCISRRLKRRWTIERALSMRPRAIKLDETAVADIRTKRMTQREYGELYGVDHVQIGKIQRYESWAHV